MGEFIAAGLLRVEPRRSVSRHSVVTKMHRAAGIDLCVDLLEALLWEKSAFVDVLKRADSVALTGIGDALAVNARRDSGAIHVGQAVVVRVIGTGGGEEEEDG